MALKALDLQGWYISDQGLTAVGEQCKQLENWNLRFCEGLTYRGMKTIEIGCAKTLKVLGIAPCTRINNNTMEDIGVRCHFLEKLTLDSKFVNDVGLLVIAQGCTTSNYLHLQCVNFIERALKAMINHIWSVWDNIFTCV